jgi:hypothetical protein
MEELREKENFIDYFIVASTLENVTRVSPLRLAASILHLPF